MHILSVLNFLTRETLKVYIWCVGTKSLEGFPNFYVLVIVKNTESCSHLSSVRVVKKSKYFW